MQAIKQDVYTFFRQGSEGLSGQQPWWQEVKSVGRILWSLDFRIGMASIRSRVLGVNVWQSLGFASFWSWSLTLDLLLTSDPKSGLFDLWPLLTTISWATHRSLASRPVLSNAPVTSYVWLSISKLIQIKWNKKFSSSGILPTFLLSSHMWPVATVLDRVDIEHFHHHRKFFLTVLGMTAIARIIPYHC